MTEPHGSQRGGTSEISAGPRPRYRLTGNPIPENRQPGYYFGYSTLAQQGFWDPATRDAVLRRVTDVPPIRFFTAQEQATLAVVLEHILPQSDRTPDRRVPILNWLDDRLYNRKISGFRYEDMPPDEDAYRIGLQAIDEMAREVHGAAFAECTYAQREALMKSLNETKPPGAHALWSKMNVKRFWRMLLHDAANAYYAHPWAWDEIGYGGPAYPRGYMRLEGGKPEPWEVDEQRYPWDAPEGCLSDLKEKY